MKANDSYRLKIGLTLNNLAREMMTYHVGDRIPAITELVERYQVSRGTVQSALAQLCGELFLPCWSQLEDLERRCFP